MDQKPKIIIIGAGLAGLTAALRLYQKQYDMDLYEATGRVGGRVHTIYMKDSEGRCFPAELGGQNIADGGRALNIQNLATDLSLDIEEMMTPYDAVSYQNGHYNDFNALLASLNWSQKQLQEKVKEGTLNAKCMEDVLNCLFSEDHILKQALYARLKAYEGLDPKDQSIYHNLETLRCILEGGLSAAHEAIHSTVQKIMVQRIRGGNAKLPLKIADILKDKIHLNKALSYVVYDKGKIKLTFKDSSEAYCDKLIIAIPTLPLQDIQFEQNMIPDHQFRNICKVQYGKNCKILTPASYSSTSCRGVVTDRQISILNQEGGMVVMYFIDEKGLPFFKEQISILMKGDPTLKISSDAPVEAQDLQFVKYECATTKIWTADPYIKGSYAGYNVALGKALDDRLCYKNIEVKEIFAPINDQIFFIGEHTTLLDEIGTMEAAVESGERIAKVFDKIW